MAETKEDAVSFVTKKVLVTFAYPVAIMINDSCAEVRCVIAEHQENKQSERYYSELPSEFTVVALADGRKLSKSQQLRVSRQWVMSTVELD